MLLGVDRRHVVLELGCGFGRSLRYLSGLGSTVYAVDISESMVRAAREACKDLNNIEYFVGEAEETGIDELSFEWGDRYFETGPYSRGKVARYFVATTDKEEVVMGPSPETGEPEHHEWRWVSFDEAYDLGSPRVRQIVQWARQIIGT